MNRTIPPLRRVVIKIGSAVLASKGSIDLTRIEQLVSDALSCGSKDLVIVTSGAVASGFRALGLTSPPKTIVQKQAAAAVGQQRLMATWARAFESHGREVAQVLLTGEDIAHRQRQQNARRTLEELLSRGIIPIINENDSVSFDEIKLGDNDRLSALVSGMLGADLLIILSGVEGLLSKGTGKVIPTITDISLAHEHVRSDKSSVGTGGMVTKVHAAETATQAGVHVVIAGGGVPRVISKVCSGEELGTHFLPGRVTLHGRRRWLGQSAKAKGDILIDSGAAKAITRGASLLPSGITGVRGTFSRGETVELKVRSQAGTQTLSRGVTAYSSDEILAFKGKRSQDIVKILGYCYSEEVVHRDHMVLLAENKK